MGVKILPKTSHKTISENFRACVKEAILHCLLNNRDVENISEDEMLRDSMSWNIYCWPLKLQHCEGKQIQCICMYIYCA